MTCTFMVTPYHCGCGSGGGVGVRKSGWGEESRHTAQPHNTQATLANHTHDPGLVGDMPGGGGVTQGVRAIGESSYITNRTS